MYWTTFAAVVLREANRYLEIFFAWKKATVTKLNGVIVILD
jgi:hypothetical protein